MPDAGIIALSIPIVAIVMGVGGDIIKRILRSQEHRLEMKLRLQEGKSNSSQAEIDALRREIAALRDTSTQFDVSLSSSVERLEQRMGRVETKVAASNASAIDETQTVGGARRM